MSNVKGFEEALEAGLKKTQIEAERKAREEKDLLKDLLAMSEDIGQIEEALLTVDQVAMQLGVSSQTVRNWEKQGKLVPAHRTEGGHRRYSQSQITELQKDQNDFEIYLKIQPKKLLETIQQVLTNFADDENISVSIKSVGVKQSIYFTLDSEDGLCTFTKKLKMEE